MGIKYLDTANAILKSTWNFPDTWLMEIPLHWKNARIAVYRVAACEVALDFTRK